MSDENKVPNRIQNFKNVSKNTEEMRRRRTTATIELRKASRDDQLLKRRNVSINEPLSPVSDNNANDSMTISEIIQVLESNDTNRLFDAVQGARKILSREKSPPIDDLVNAGIVPKLVSYLDPHYGDNSRLQFEACWALTNIASGTSSQTLVVIDAGAVPKLVQLLSSPDVAVMEQATWALGNIAGDGPAARDLVLEYGTMETIISLITPDRTLSAVRNLVWCVSNLCRNKNPSPPFHIVRKALPILRQLLTSGDPEILGDVSWALSYMTDGPDTQIQVVVEAGVIPSLVALLDNQQVSVLTPALRAVGNTVTGNAEQTDCVLEAGALPLLRKLLLSTRMNIVKEAAWSISNVTAGTPEQIQKVIDSDIVPALITVLKTGDYKAQKEAAYAITNMTANATINQLAILLGNDFLPAFCHLMGSKDTKVIMVVLEGIQNLLQKVQTVGELDKVALMIEECGGCDKLEALLQHELKKIYDKAYYIIATFFGEDEGEAINDLAPERGESQYEFNVNDPSGNFNF